MREKAGLGRCVSVGKVLGLQAWRSESSPQYSHKKTCMEGPCSPSPGSVEIGGSLGFADCQPSSQFSVNPHDGGPQLCMCMHRCMYPHIHTHASTQMKKCWEWWRWLQTGTDKTGLSVQGQALMTIGRTVLMIRIRGGRGTENRKNQKRRMKKQEEEVEERTRGRKK